jgi:hypothetical protein
LSYYRGALAQLARAPPLQGGGHRFESDMLHHEKSLVLYWAFFVVVLTGREPWFGRQQAARMNYLLVQSTANAYERSKLSYMLHYMESVALHSALYVFEDLAICYIIKAKWKVLLPLRINHSLFLT